MHAEEGQGDKPMRTYKEAKSGRWYVDYLFGGERVRYPAGDNKREADQLGSRITLEINAGHQDPERTKRLVRGKGEKSPTFEAVLDEFLKCYRPRSGNMRYYLQRSKLWRVFFKGHCIGDITEGDVLEFRNKRRDEASSSTVRKDLISLGTFFGWARQKGYVSTNPADARHVKRPRESFDPQQVRWLSDEEFVRLKGVAPAWLNAVITWAIETGMDRGKILRLRWQELDLDRSGGRIIGGGFAMQRDKTGKPVRQVLADGAIEALRRASRTRQASGNIFLNERGQPIDEKALEWALGKTYGEAGISGCNFRTFRHTFATRALRRGIAREVLAKMMGHSTAFITERYMHVADDQLRAAARALSGPEKIDGSYMAEGSDDDSRFRVREPLLNVYAA